eukprot:g8588.t1
MADEKKIFVDRNSISADFDEDAAEILTVEDKDEFCLDGGAPETTPQTAVHTPQQVSSYTAGLDDEDGPSTPASSSPGTSSRSSRKGKKGLASYGKRALNGFRRFLDIDSSPGRAKEHVVASGANEDRFLVFDDLLAVDTPPPTPSAQPFLVGGGGGGAGGGGGGGGEAWGSAAGGEAWDTREKIAGVSAMVGKVGLYGAFDGHGGSSCADFVSRNLPQGVRDSSAWARLAGGDHDNITTHDRRQDTEGKAVARPEDQQIALGGVAASDDGGGLDDLLVGVMREAILDGFRSTQEAFARQTRSGNNSGSTATVAIVCRRHVVVANLGDSGGLFHNDRDTLGGGPLTDKTEVHTVSNEGERRRVEAAGGTFAANGRLFGKLQPTRSFGDQDIHRIREGVLIAEPELTVHQVRPTANGVAFLVLGSDGLWESVQDSKVIDIVRAEEARSRSKKKPEKVPLRVAELLVKKAHKVTIDDITAVVILFNKHFKE